MLVINDLLDSRVDKYARSACMNGQRGDECFSHLGHYVPRDFFVEVQADGVGAGIDCVDCVGDVGDAADFDAEHGEAVGSGQ